jgi:hypothetical protein
MGLLHVAIRILFRIPNKKRVSQDTISTLPINKE